MLFIDVSNVLHTTGVLPPEIAGIDLDGLVRLLGISRFAKRRLLLVCDGHPGRRERDGRGRAAPTPPGRADIGLEIAYAGSGRTADDVLIDRMNACHHGRSATLVSSDRELIAVATRRGLRSLTSAAFLLQLSTDHRLSPVRHKARARAERPEFATRVPLPAAEVGVWLKILLGDTPRPDISTSPQSHALDADQEFALRELLAQVDDVMARAGGARSNSQPAFATRPKPRRRAAAPPVAQPAAPPTPPSPSPMVQVDPELARLLKDFSLELHAADLEKLMNAPGTPPPRPRDEAPRAKPRAQGRRR